MDFTAAICNCTWFSAFFIFRFCEKLSWKHSLSNPKIMKAQNLLRDKTFVTLLYLLIQHRPWGQSTVGLFLCVTLCSNFSKIWGLKAPHCTKLSQFASVSEVPVRRIFHPFFAWLHFSVSSETCMLGNVSIVMSQRKPIVLTEGPQVGVHMLSFSPLKIEGLSELQFLEEAVNTDWQ